MVDSLRVNVYNFSEAPSWARHCSTFSTDDRCEEILVITGVSEREVHLETVRQWDLARSKTNLLCDFDTTQSNENDLWVGTVCMDRAVESEKV